MVIKDVKINWMLDWGNDPSIYLLVDKLPDESTLVYKQKNSLWFAESGGYVQFFSWSGPGNERGFGGAEFKINTTKGPVTLKGPWSSNSQAMNDHGFTPCTEVAITDDPKVFDRGHTFFGRAVTIDLLAPVLSARGIELSCKEGRYFIDKKQAPQGVSHE